jgi:hypothetical protein
VASATIKTCVTTLFSSNFAKSAIIYTVKVPVPVNFIIVQAPHVVTVGLPEVVPEYLEVGNLKITTPDPPAFPGANGPPTEGKFPEPPPPPPPVFAVPAVAAIPDPASFP